MYDGGRALPQCCFNDGPHFQRSGDVETVLFQCITLITFGILNQTSPNFQGSHQTDRQTDRYFIDRKKVNPDLFVIELEICTCIYNIVNLLKSYDNIHSMSYTTKIMLTGIALRNTGYVL